MKKFLQVLVERNIISIDGNIDKPDYVFGSHIPLGGALKNIYYQNVLLIGDAAGFCGAFAADGIKGSVISGKEGALLIEQYLKGNESAPGTLRERMEAHGGMMGYYTRQLHYRWIWDLMKSDRTFRAMYKIIEAEQETFLNQFCDAKDKRRSLSWTVLKVRYIPKLVVYAWYVLLDLFKRT